jgi:hypothetical protein
MHKHMVVRPHILTTGSSVPKRTVFYFRKRMVLGAFHFVMALPRDPPIADVMEA